MAACPAQIELHFRRRVLGERPTCLQLRQKRTFQYVPTLRPDFSACPVFADNGDRSKHHGTP
jgi:hypothetical protein